MGAECRHAIVHVSQVARTIQLERTTPQGSQPGRVPVYGRKIAGLRYKSAAQRNGTSSDANLEELRCGGTNPGNAPVF